MRSLRPDVNTGTMLYIGKNAPFTSLLQQTLRRPDPGLGGSVGRLV